MRLTAEERVEIEKALSVNRHDLQGEFEKLPAQVAYVHGLYARATEEALEAELDSKLITSRRCARLREELALHGVKVTERALTEALEYDVEWQDAKVVEIAAEAMRLRMRGYVEALASKRDALVSLGASERAERERDPVVKDRNGRYPRQDE